MKLIAFDMDSTLIQCEVIDEIARLAGVYKDVSRITELAMNGELDFSESLRMRVAELKGIELSALSDFAKNLPYTDGLDDLVEYLKKNNFRIAILSGGFDFFAKEIMKKYDFDFLYCNQLEEKNGILTGQVYGEIIDKERKAFYLKDIADKLNVSVDDTVAVGDGANDLLMLNTARIGIAFNAKDSVKKQAKYHLDSKNISKIITIIENEWNL